MKTISNTTVKNINKSNVFKAAWALIRKHEVSSLSEALKKAWKAMKLKAQMIGTVVTFQYRKANGEVRKAIGTLVPSFVKYQIKGTDKKKSYSSVAYWDIEKDSFRSFSIASLL